MKRDVATDGRAHVGGATLGTTWGLRAAKPPRDI
jgi:hypothetical protein